MKVIMQELAELNPDAILAVGLEDALVGYTENFDRPHVAVYDYEKCVRVLMDRDGSDRSGADDFLCSNTLCAYVGENGPLFVKFAQ